MENVKSLESISFDVIAMYCKDGNAFEVGTATNSALFGIIEDHGFPICYERLVMKNGFLYTKVRNHEERTDFSKAFMELIVSIRALAHAEIKEVQ